MSGTSVQAKTFPLLTYYKAHVQDIAAEHAIFNVSSKTNPYNPLHCRQYNILNVAYRSLGNFILNEKSIRYRLQTHSLTKITCRNKTFLYYNT